MTKQKVISLRLTSGELDALGVIVRDRGRRESRQLALIWHLRRAYRGACKAAGQTPNERLLFDSPTDSLLTPDELERQTDTLADILAAAQAARDDLDDDDEYEFNDYGQPAEIYPEEEEDQDDDEFAGGWIAC